MNTKSISLLILLLSTFSVVVLAGPKDQSDVEKQRAEQLEKWGDKTIPNPNEVIAAAKLLLTKPIEQQSIASLLLMAEKSNIAANYVEFILSEYADYYSDNYRYEFVQEKIAPYHDNYVRLSNELKSQRNQSFFNMGIKLLSEGNNVEAFFYFRDAYRLSSFTQDEGDHKGLRYQAEQEMKKLMGLEKMESFIYWKD